MHHRSIFRFFRNRNNSLYYIIFLPRKTRCRMLCAAIIRNTSRNTSEDAIRKRMNKRCFDVVVCIDRGTGGKDGETKWRAMKQLFWRARASSGGARARQSTLDDGGDGGRDGRRAARRDEDETRVRRVRGS